MAKHTLTVSQKSFENYFVQCIEEAKSEGSPLSEVSIRNAARDMAEWAWDILQHNLKGSYKLNIGDIVYLYSPTRLKIFEAEICGISTGHNIDSYQYAVKVKKDTQKYGYYYYEDVGKDDSTRYTFYIEKSDAESRLKDDLLNRLKELA